MTTTHATCVAIRGRGVLLAGPSGAGKSDLALRLLDRGAQLVSDDYTVLSAADGVLTASAPATIAGRLEVRGIGIVARPALRHVRVALLIEAGVHERMPEPRTCVMMGIPIPMCRLPFLEPSAPLKVELALEQLA